MSSKKIPVRHGQTLRVIKMDSNPGSSGGTSAGGETITDIQNYLETFNKEIEGGDSVNSQIGIKFETSEVTGEVAEVDGGESGAYYIDQATGQYYYESRSEDGQRVMTVVPGIPESHAVEDQFVPIDNQNDETEVTEDVQVMDENGQMVLGTGDSYQTVTIVPSETSTGEVSYVLIVQQPEDKEKEEDQDLTVYDFDDHEEQHPVSGAESGDEEDKAKIIKMIPKKSQTVTQAHMCNYCNYTSPKRYLLSRHMKSHSEERPHKCSVCERGFKTLASLQNHVNTHTGTKPHRCKYCQSAFTTSGELVRHVRYKHTHEKPHKCSICDYASVELSKMRNHMRCHTGERPYQCPHCTYASPDTFKLKRHLRIHTGEKPYECDICPSRFTQSNSLKAHKLIHSAGDKPVYRCELCPATCGRKTDLRIHVQKLHTSDKPLKCKRCGKQFPDRYTYKVHNKSHEGEKCWKCDLCPYASVSQRHLESHMLIHTDEKPYQCEQCDQAFRQKQLLKRHQNLYHNPNYVPPVPREKTHECPECNRAFRHKGNLIRHMSAHDPESSAAEKALALKLGRQKKVQIIDGQQVEVMPGEDGDEEEEMETDIDGNVVAVEGSDGQQYVVLEVIQLQDSEECDPQVAVVSGSGGVEQAVAMLSDDNQAEEILPTLKSPQSIETDCSPVKKPSSHKSRNMEQDMDNCFGFDEDEDDRDEVETVIPSKADIHILTTGGLH
ncbi:transcriptional repressor CTCFL [Halyomorpha halys]|uniref:transcriptional repressor CTCFL n=1 Tax=Halyomorpha halys TaxID=286706 RepID=UPI0006D5145D|nr:transcriptional repressor CTCFL-like [Halyomorpha halys]XP_014290448.1 transcriptional repressor CTCFL-like [Halyomorpha halys]